MSAKIRYTNEQTGAPKVIRDFRPSPEELAFRDEDVKISISRSEKSVEFFRSAAAKSNAHYQRMIRRLLDAYVDAHAGALTGRSTRTRTRGARPESLRRQARTPRIDYRPIVAVAFSQEVQ
jgi:hypothetical protein